MEEMTIGDKIRSMDNSHLADFISEITCCHSCPAKDICSGACDTQIKKWLDEKYVEAE